jgi:hypothetical protein
MRLDHEPELLARFRRGDRDAMAAVFDHYAPPLARYLVGGFGFESQMDANCDDPTASQYNGYRLELEWEATEDPVLQAQVPAGDAGT